MKKLFLFFPALLLLSAASYAQRFEIGLNIGPTFFGGSNNDQFARQLPLMTEVYSNLTLMVKWPDYDIAMKFGGNALRYKYDEPDFNDLIVTTSENDIMFSVDRRIHINRLEVYGGLSAGFLFYANADRDYYSRIYPNSWVISSSGVGYMAGLQVGADYPVSRRLDINMELAAYYTHINASNDYNTYGLFYEPDQFKMNFIKMPLTVGLKYKTGVGRRNRRK